MMHGCLHTQLRCTTLCTNTAQVPVPERQREDTSGQAPRYDPYALLQFPSEKAAEAFVNDPECAPHAAARQSGSESRFVLIDNTDLAGTIPYLPKG
jgi:Domain of unknown function (DUF1330)